MNPFSLPPELLAQLGPLLPVVLVCLYILKRLFDTETKHQKLQDDVAACKERLIKLETQTTHFDVLMQELRGDIAGLRDDIKKLLERKE